MTLLKILQYPDLRLGKKAKRVVDIKEPRIQKILADMFETLAATDNCAALAATQLDIDDAPAITVINDPEKPGAAFALINPEVVAASGEITEDEACMSVAPDRVSALVKRAAEVTVKALNQNGEPITIEASDFLARCLQHEIDHLNGYVYLDRLSDLKRQRVEKRLDKLLAPMADD